MLAAPETIQHLQAARNLIADPERWCADSLGQRQSGEPVRHRGDIGLAIRVCAMGALHASGDLVGCGVAFTYLRKASIELFGVEEPAKVNNTIGHAAVLQMYTRAIELAAADIGAEAYA